MLLIPCLHIWTSCFIYPENMTTEETLAGPFHLQALSCQFDDVHEHSPLSADDLYIVRITASKVSTINLAFRISWERWVLAFDRSWHWFIAWLWSRVKWPIASMYSLIWECNRRVCRFCRSSPVTATLSCCSAVLARCCQSYASATLMVWRVGVRGSSSSTISTAGSRSG